MIPAGRIIRSEQLHSQEVVWHYWAGKVFHPPGRTGAKEATHFRGAVDAALVFETELDLDESLFWIIGIWRLKSCHHQCPQATPT